MLLGEHHHSGRVAEMPSQAVRLRQLMHPMVNDKPAVPSQDGRGAAANLEVFPGKMLASLLST